MVLERAWHAVKTAFYWTSPFHRPAFLVARRLRKLSPKDLRVSVETEEVEGKPARFGQKGGKGKGDAKAKLVKFLVFSGSFGKRKLTSEEQAEMEGERMWRLQNPAIASTDFYNRELGRINVGSGLNGFFKVEPLEGNAHEFRISVRHSMALEKAARHALE